MVFIKPTRDLDEGDIMMLLDRAEPEQILLDYKEEIEASDHFKKELAKDVSAFANSRGGYLLVGVSEKEGKPVAVPGIARMLGQQKVEEWVEQVALSNISPRLPIETKVVELTNSDKVVLIVRVRESWKGPHMVTFQHDNRYYRRFNNLSMPAEEYEVRELFERGIKYQDRVQEYLKARNYDTPENPQFGFNEWTRRLRYFLSREEIVDVRSFFTFIAIPLALEDDVIDTRNSQFLNWLDPNQRRYAPFGQSELLFQGHGRPTFDGLVFPDEISGDLVGYLLINRNGYIEYCKERLVACEPSEKKWCVFLKDTVNHFHLFLSFVDDLYKQPSIRYEQDLRILANGVGLASTEAAEMRNPLIWRGTSVPKNNIQMIYDVEAPQLPDVIIEIVEDFAIRLSNNYGLSELPGK
jgi:hypothetical protein